MTHVNGAAVYLTRMVFGGNVVARGMRPSGVLPSVIVVVEVAAPFGCAAECYVWCFCNGDTVVEFAGCSLDNLFITLLDSVEFVMMRSNFVKVLAGYFCCNFRDCGSFVKCCRGAAK